MIVQAKRLKHMGRMRCLRVRQESGKAHGVGGIQVMLEQSKYGVVNATRKLARKLPAFRVISNAIVDSQWHQAGDIDGLRLRDQTVQQACAIATEHSRLDSGSQRQ